MTLVTSDSETQDGQRGVVRSIAYRPRSGDPMVEATECRVIRDRGLADEIRDPGTRQVTLLSVESWSEACRELGATLPWTYRRANLLVEGFDLAATIGLIIAVGSVRVGVHDEAEPCDLIDHNHAGLRQALTPHCRGGVFGAILDNGTIRVGDHVAIARAR